MKKAAIAGLGVVDSDDSSPIGRLIEPRRYRAAQHTVALIGAALAGDHQDPALAGRLGIAELTGLAIVGGGNSFKNSANIRIFEV